MADTTAVQTKNVKLLGGPMDRQTIAVPRSAEVFAVGKPGRAFWFYTYASKVGREEYFAIKPRSRAMQRFVFWAIGNQGKDPRVEQHIQKTYPKRDGVSRKGQGAARRRAKRETV